MAVDAQGNVLKVRVNVNACPHCGSERFKVYYPDFGGDYCSVTFEDGVPEVDDVEGCWEGYDCGQNEEIRCVGCDQAWTLGTYVFEESEGRKYSDSHALERIQCILDGRVWSGADDMPAIAEILRETGREVGPPR